MIVHGGLVRGTKVMPPIVQFVFGLFLIVIVVGTEATWARGVVELPAGASASAASKKVPASTGEMGLLSPGRLLGTVTDVAGVPLDDTLISATGPSGTALVVCDVNGRFEFRGLRPGSYLLRAHVYGFKPANRHVVQVRSGLATTRSVTLRRTDGTSNVPSTLLAAGFVPGSGTSDGIVEAEALQPVEGADLNLTGAGPDGAVEYGVTQHDDSDKAWWLRRARRSVLKDTQVELVAIDTLAFEGPGGARLGFGSGSVTGSPSVDLSRSFPLLAQFHLLTRTSVHSPHDFQATNILPGQIAYVSLGGIEQDQVWGVRGAVRTGDAGSWVLSGTYLAGTSQTNALAIGMSYSRQRVQTGDLTLSAFPRDLGRSADDPRRDAGSVRADGQWTLNPSMTLDYGATLAGYGYLEEAYLFSPNVAVTFTPFEGTRVRLGMSQYMLAPGAEEFLPPSEGVWLPPVRTFAQLSSTDPLHAERSRHFEIAVEHDVGRTSTVGVRRFAQNVDDQIITLFGARLVPSVSSSDHYYMTSASGVTTDGWAVMFAHEVGDRFTGSVDYSIIDAEWAPWMVSGLSPRTVSVLRSGSERIHDITTSIETVVPESATRVLLLYRFSSAFANRETGTEALRIGFGGRFALRVRQTLPFSPIGGSNWEVLFDIRSLFREQVAGASVYDELLVVNPPKEVVGGLVVNF